MTWPAAQAQMDRTVVAVFGLATTYAPAGGNPVIVAGIFDAAYVRVAAGEAGVSSTGPAVFYRVADLPANPVHDDPRIMVDGVDYEVVEAVPDGQGGVLLRLHRL